MQPCATCGVMLAPNQVHRQEWAVIGWDDEYGSNEVQVPYCYACTWLQDREQVLREYERSVSALDAADGRDLSNLWRLSHEALMWLYMLDRLLEDYEPMKAEYRKRKKDDAPALIGLTWVRGAANHKRLFDFHDASTTVPVAEWGGAQVVAVAAAWKSYPVCPDNFKSQWLCYVSHVEGRPIMDPLNEAREFLVSLSESFWFPADSVRTGPDE